MKPHVLLWTFLLNLTFFGQNASNCPILPTPVTYISTGDSIQFNALGFDSSSTPSFISTAIFDVAKLYQTELVTAYKDSGFVTFHPLLGGYPNAYSINVSKTGIRIQYTSEASCFYALHSLMQLVTKKEDEPYYAVPTCFVKDYPKYNWRGMHLDVSRHFFSVDEVKKYLDLMSLYKFNVFHWHLTDDQGWRIEIKKYPKLTTIGAWRDSTVENHFSTYPRTYHKQLYGGFYTQEEIKEIVQYAQARYINIVPEIEMPGHARAALAAYPALSCTGKQQGVEGLWGVFDDVFCAKDSSILFLQDVLSEVVDLFPGPFVHIGGDEAQKTRWEKCPNCQKVIADNHLKNEHELQSYFIKRMDTFLTSKGKKLIGWDEILEGGLSPNAAVMSWRGMEGGIEAAKQGHYVVMSPGSHCYFDHYQSKSSSEPLAIGGYTPLQKVYEFSPISPEMTATQAGYVMGGQANLWTEYISSFDQLTYMAYPRAIALSQALWCTQKPPYAEFEKTLRNYHIIDLLMNPNLDVYPCLDFMTPHPFFKRFSNGIQLRFNFPDTSEAVVLVSNFASADSKWMAQGDSLLIPRQTSKIEPIHITYFSVCCADSFDIVPHKAMGCEVNFITPPSKQYNPGSLVLVDGQKAARPWRGFQWVGFDTSQVEFQITLPTRQKLKKVTLNFLYEPNSWIYLPLTATISTKSNDRIKVKSYKISGETTDCKFKTRAKYITILIKGEASIPVNQPGAGNTPWIFMDEVTVE
jgi:hexosaminidase